MSQAALLTRCVRGPAGQPSLHVPEERPIRVVSPQAAMAWCVPELGRRERGGAHPAATVAKRDDYLPAQFRFSPISWLWSFACQRPSLRRTSSAVAAVPATSRIDT